MLWKQQTLKTASRGCVKLKHWTAHKWSWFQILWFRCFIYFQMKTNKPKKLRNVQNQPNKYPQTTHNTNQTSTFHVLIRYQRSSWISTKNNLSPLSYSLSELFHSATLYFSILFFHVLHPACLSLLNSSGSKPWTLSLHLKDGKLSGATDSFLVQTALPTLMWENKHKGY